MTDAKGVEIRRRAADDLIRLSNMFRGLLQIGEHMKSVADLEQVASEAEARLAETNRQIEAARKEASEQIEEAKRYSAEQIAQHHKKSEQVLNDKLSARRTELTNIQDSHDLVLAKLRTAREDLNSHSLQIAEAKSTLEGLGEQIEEKVQALKVVKDQHKALVASITNIK